MNKIYPAFFFNEGADTVCIFPDFDGMSTYGTGRTEALAMAVDALVGTLSLMILDGQDLPTPSNFTSADAKRIAEKSDLLSPELRLLATVGFCGGFTTFSTFVNENYLLLGMSEGIVAIAYALASLAVGLGCVYAGHLLVR